MHEAMSMATPTTSSARSNTSHAVLLWTLVDCVVFFIVCVIPLLNFGVDE